MAKRVYDQTVKKWALRVGIPVGIAGFTLLVLYLSTLGLIEVTNYSDDIICAGTLEDPCLAFINFTAKEDIFIYPIGYDPWGRNTLFSTDEQLESWNIYRSWGKGWREIKLSETCKGTWCGAPRGGALYSFAFREGREYQIKIEALKKDPTETIKWGFGPVDPFWYGVGAIDFSSNLTTLNIELGSILNISTNLSGAATVCVDIDHPDYGDNYTCGTPDANFLFNISYFRKTELNDSSTSKNITFTGAENQTIWIEGHQYDEINNASINLTGYDYSIVSIYINNTLSNSVGELSNDIITLFSFGGDYYLVGTLVDGTTAALDAGDCTGDGCAEFWDDNWATYATLTGGDDANITVNYTIPTSYPIHSGWINWKAQASSSNDLFVYCKDNGVWIDAVAAVGYSIYGIDATANYTIPVASECYDDESKLEWKYEYLSVSYIFESEVRWYEVAKLVEFSAPGVETFTINISSDANVTSATFNISSALYENALDQESITDEFTYLVSLQPAVTISQRFKPAYSNLSRVAVYVDKTLFTDEGDLTVRVGTTANGSEIGSDTINYNSIGTTPAWEYISLDVDLTTGNIYYITLDGPTLLASGITYGYRWYRTAMDEGIYDRGGMTSLTSGISYNVTGDFAFRTYIDDFPENITLEIGDIDGTYEWNYTGEFSTEEEVVNFTEELNDYLETCTTTLGYCLIPAYVFSRTPGSLIFTKIEINYTSDPNPIYLDVSLIEDFLNSSSGFADIPITITSDQATTIGVSDVRYDYAGGNDTIDIFVYEVGDKSNNDTFNLIHYYSDWDYEFPTYIDWLEFIPTSPTAKNITPYGQSSSQPIFNITNYGYGGKNSNFFSYLNETYSCVDLFMSSANTKPSASLWDELISYLSFDIDARDNWGNNNGTVEGATFNETEGQLGGAYEFDGINDFINLSNDSSLNFKVGNFTIVAWIKTDFIPPDDRDFVSKLNDDWDGYSLALSGSTYQPYFYIAPIGGGGTESVKGTTNITDGNWYHLVAVRAGLNMTIFVNATPENSIIMGANKNVSTGGNMIIGAAPSTPEYYFNGSIDEVKIFNRSLSRNEISELYTRSYNKYYDIKMGPEWSILKNNFSYLNSMGLRMWVDYDCNFTTWRLWEPELYFRNCCENCVCSEDLA